MIAPDAFRTIPCPTYPDLRLGLGALVGGKMDSLIREAAPEAIYIASEGPLGWAARRWCVRRGVPFTTGFHTRFAEYVSARFPVPVGWGWAVLRRFHGAAERVLVATPSLAEELQGRGFTNVAPWTRGVDVETFRPEPDAGLGLPRPVHLYVGRVAVEKNLEAFLSLDLPGSKVVVGDGPARESLEARHPEAHFLGPRFGADLAHTYASADVFVFPSLTDTFGLVVLEALASGVPVAAFPVTGPKDIIGDAPVGALDDDLGAACTRALRMPREQCRVHALKYTWPTVTEMFRDALTPIEAEGEPVVEPV